MTNTIKLTVALEDIAITEAILNDDIYIKEMIYIVKNSDNCFEDLGKARMAAVERYHHRMAKQNIDSSSNSVDGIIGRSR